MAHSFGGWREALAACFDTRSQRPNPAIGLWLDRDKYRAIVNFYHDVLPGPTA